jgi:hypothetical protein
MSITAGLGLGCSGSGSNARPDAGRDLGASGGSGGGSGGSGGGNAGSGGSGGSGGALGGTGGTITADAAPSDALVPVDVSPDVAPRVYEAPKAPWLGKDIGAVGTPGGVSLNTTVNGGQNFDLNAGGTTGIGGTADSLFFMYQPLAGPAALQGRLVSLNMADPASAGGFMIRESLDPDAAMVFVGAVGDGTGGKVIIRKAKGEAAVTAPTDGTTLPAVKAANATVIRLVRTGSVVRISAGSVAAIDTAAALVGGGMAEINIANPNATLLYGMAVTASSAAGAAQARFNETGVHNLPSNNATATWSHWSIGTTAASAVWTTGNRLTLTALGQPWGAVAGTSRDFLGFASFRTIESRSLRFLVTTQSMSDPASRVAAMIRDVSSFARAASTIALSLTQAGGLELQQRPDNGDASDLVKVAAKEGVKAPLWLRLDRALVPRPGDPLGAVDTVVSAYYAEDNGGVPRTWLLVGSPLGFPSTLANPPALGIAVGSYAPAVFHQAEVSRIEVVAAPPPPPPPDGGAPADASPPAEAGSPPDGGAASDGG